MDRRRRQERSWSSLEHFAVGYTIAGLLGVGVGALLWKFHRLGHAVSPLLYFVYVIPTAALLPAIVAVMGIGSSMKITIIVLAAVWPTLLNTLDGMRGIDPVKLDTAKVLHMSGPRTVRTVVLPGAMPQIMAGLRHSLQIAVIMMVVSELVASRRGSGSSSSRPSSGSRSPRCGPGSSSWASSGAS